MWVKSRDAAGNLGWRDDVTGAFTYADPGGSGAAGGSADQGSTLPGPISVPNLHPQYASTGGSGAGGAGGGVLGAIPVIGPILGALGGFLGGLFGGGSSSAPPTLQQQFVDTLRQLFPDQNAPICGIPWDISYLNGGQPALVNIPCDDPNFGKITRAGLEWAMKTWGLGALFKDLYGFIQTPAGAPQGGGQVAVTVSPTIDASINVGADALSGVSDAITSGVKAALTQSSAQTQSVLDAVTGQLDTSVGKISDFLGAFTTGIPAFFTSMVTTLMNPFNAITGSLSSAIGAVGAVLKGIEQEVLKPLGTLITSSVSGLAGIEQTISQQIGALGGDIQKLLGFFGQQIPDSINNVEKVLERIGTIWTKVSDQIHFETIDADLKNMGDAIAGIAGKKIDTVFRPIDLINETCDIAKFDEEISKSKEKVDDLDSILKPLADIGMYVFLQAARLLATVEKMKEQGAESINQDCPITKLDPGTVVSLWRRGILNEESAKHELLVQGYNPDRTKALYDGTAFLESPATALDYWYRGIASDDDLRGLLLSNGFSTAQVEASKVASVQIGDPQTALRGWLYNLLTEGEVDKVLKVNRFDQAQAELIKALSLRPPTTGEMLEGENVRSVLGSFSLPSVLGIGTDWDSIPQWYQDAGRAEGLSPQAIQQRWWAHWTIPPVNVAIEEYFRGYRTLSEVRSIMDRFHIPSTLQLDLINVQRPLIPFRTIPSMMANGILTEDQARHRLTDHGFNSGDIDVLISYAKLSKPKASAAASTASHATSLATAHTLFEDGTITEQQYQEILAEHGLVQSAIDATVTVAKLEHTVKARKQAGTDIVNEFQAGVLTIDQAKQQLAQLGMTVAEQANYTRRLHAAKTANAKIPSEGDLNHFLQNSIISSDQYKAALVASGYTDEWATAFLQYRTKPTTSTPAPTAPTAPTTGG